MGPLEDMCTLPQWKDHAPAFLSIRLKIPCVWIRPEVVLLDHCSLAYFPFSPCVSRTRSKCLPHSLRSPRPARQCKRGESCKFMMRLFGGLIRPLQNKIICQILQHLSEITQAQRCCLSITTVDKTGVKCLGPIFQSDEESVYGYTQAEWDKCIMGYVVSTGRPLNIRDSREVINEECSVSSLTWPHSQFRSLVDRGSGFPL